MTNSDDTWKIAIDTGGTFTDCIAVNPAGETKRVKVLSSSKLRGTLLEKIAKCQFRFQVNWAVQKDIFQGYSLELLVQKNQPRKLIQMNFAEAILETDEDFELEQPTDFEITAYEEAPVLAIRIITQTSLQDQLPSINLRLGSTKGTNALLERKGARLAFLVTKGFRDLIKIGTQQRPNLFQLDIPEVNCFYKQVIEVEERMDAQGNILQSLSEVEMERIARLLTTNNIKVVAIAFLHAYRNSVHERKLANYLAQKRIEFISISSELSSNIKILPRAQTALVNAYLSPIIANYLKAIATKLTASKFKVMTSAGGLVDTRFFAAKDSLLSGPAGGLVGAAQIGKSLGFDQLLSFDMGGTSTDAARYDGAFDYNYITKVADAELLSPTLAIETVAAGGGSICYFDGHKLCVGPESAGASPGPACYGAGGPLTISDVNLLLSKMDASAFSIPVRLEAAIKALEKLRNEINEFSDQPYTALDLLRGYERIANEKMAEAIRKISVAQGFNPEDYAMVVFGGAGGLHSCQIAHLLEIKTILLPYDGGLLSAYGIGQAQIERIVEKQILEAWEVCENSLEGWIKALTEEGIAQLQKEGFAKEDIKVNSQKIFLRFKGQSSSLGIEWDKSVDCLARYEQKYRQLFGHFPQHKSIELESIKILVNNCKETKPRVEKDFSNYYPNPVDYVSSIFQTKEKTAIFDWDELRPGALIKGPAILKNAYATSFIEADWQFELKANKNGIVRALQKKKQVLMTKELIALELFTHRFKAIAEEMGAQLQRTAFSVNIKERLDFSCALLDAEANLLVNAPHIPVHLGSLGICARLVKEKINLGIGDVVITNHPKYGGSHLPDITLISAVFSPNGNRIGYVVNRAHHAELGGKRPGSMPPDARCLEEEGVVILPSYLLKAGIIQWEAIEHLLTQGKYPTRAFKENMADLNAALASLKIGEEKLKDLVEKQGLERVHFYMNKIQLASFDSLQKALIPYFGKVFYAEESMDDGHKICVKINIAKEQLEFDFSGTSEVHPFNLNANISIVYSAIIYVLRLLCKKAMPLNEGLMKKVKIKLPNCFLNPEFSDDANQCPAVVGGNTECSQRLVDTLLKAFGIVACSQGTMNNFLFGNSAFGYYETIGGGCGAGPRFSGRSAVHQHMTNTRMTDPEELEFHYPVHLHQCAIRENSGGEGKWKGGDGIIRVIEFLEELDLTLISQHREVAPYGSAGGGNGKPGVQYLKKKSGLVEKIKGIDSRRVQAGDQIIIETPGGGGWGN